jgi:lipid II isoglutaminyl synthase (glutamine-hydrolysing)
VPASERPAPAHNRPPPGRGTAGVEEEEQTIAGNSEPLSPRAKLAVTAGRAAAAVSRAAGKGSGSVIGGKVALRFDPDLLARLARHLDVVLVSATNGKTTTTRLLAEALRAGGPVVSNALGANMPAGITSALAGGSDARYGVIEVDEKYLAGVARDVNPKAIALLNLSRDQLDRAAETRMLAEKWREGLAGVEAIVVANADDPLIVWAASSSPTVVWVAAGQQWKDDAWSCPSCGGVLQRPSDEDWFCAECGFRRPTPSWALSGDHVVDPYGVAWPIHLQLPGRANKSNAAVSAAAAAAFGIDPKVALERMYKVQAVAGRYDVVGYRQRELRLLLAKNPAGWLETFSLIDGPPAPVILSVNARGADGTDTSWLWDVDYTRLAGHPIMVIGDRKLDLAVRLEVACQQFRVCADLDDAVRNAPPGRIETIANYTAFQDLRRKVGN